MSPKRCPFCKEEISMFHTYCPHCGRVIIETFKNPSLGDNAQRHNKSSCRRKIKKVLINLWNRQKTLIDKVKDKFRRKKKIYTYRFDKWKKYKRIIFILLIIIIIVLIIRSGDNTEYGKNDSTISTPPSIQKEYISLPNGTIIDSIPLYLDGLGEISIDNGTSMDALAKLVRNYPRKSVYTVYVKAKSIYKMTEISDGYYHLYFVHGQDWDIINRKFLVNASYSKFEDGFDFVTQNEYLLDGISTRYTVFEITLHSVLGGSAETDKVSEKEFNQF